ncbi:hypothetical protein SPRG_14116 [Saprolegnia parasitica CBS 223.65]|uniref:Uncharacterized protein n=1 Tax=Saprolegnia parasitica (strain CBS 223.65) TaxID=695850 RepID=A0A067BQU7_SAPPC|nr:hypothetical protein SPRG_14116 [Saprolegnia parasitica CBS 223.65]KDO20884.1 hypothetical protein SPRG_14116 [Saprolegnia parasitica CBS 223.65]|eukprot:XP_012208374.1 hypothetical protein SPRG_14116 [Saprolegnia parasitica CBS 223.65]
MKKRSRLALPPQSPDGLRETPVEVVVIDDDESPKHETSKQVDYAVASPPTDDASLGPELRLYQEGLDGDWLQLAWMRTRAEVPASEALPTEMVLPSVTCNLHDILPSTKSSPRPISSSAVNNSADVPLAQQRSKAECMAKIQAWLRHGDGDVPWPSCDAQLLADCDWATMLTPPPSPSTLCAIVRASSSPSLYRQLWLQEPLLRATLVHAGALRDVAVLTRLVDCDHVRSMAPRAFRSTLRQLDLRKDGEDVGIYLESELVRVYHTLR